MAAKLEGISRELEVVPRFLPARIDLPPNAGIQDVFRSLSIDINRTKAVAVEIVEGYRQGRKLLVLSERTAHLDEIRATIDVVVDNLFVLHGRMPKKQREALIVALNALPPEAPRALLATGKLVGEGFDHPPLDTLLLAMPISWKGTLQQYSGRLHRELATKADIKIVDFVDTGHPALLRMWDKRQKGYRAMGIESANRIHARSWNVLVGMILCPWPSV